MAFDFEIQKLQRELKKQRPKRVLVQLAEGIKQNAVELSKIFEDLNIEPIFSGESCWGGCAIGIHEAKDVNADLIVHFGHAEFIKVDFPVIYVNVKDLLDLDPILKESLPVLKKYKRIGLSYGVQHHQDIIDIQKFYEKNGKKVVISKKRGRAAYPGHVVGCEYTGLKAIQDQVDAFLVIGNNFHSMGAALAVEKPVFLIDVYNYDVRNMDKEREKILRQRAISIDRLKDAEKVGIIQEIKPGQKFGTPDYLVKKFKEQGKKVIVITMSELTPDKLVNFYDIQAFIILACPRIPLDDFAKYPRPILTFKEALVALEVKKWDDLLEMGFV